MRLDIAAFHALNVIVEEGSFAKAAKKLHKAQSAVSYQIKKLEQHLHVEIFDRNQYRAELTPAGQVVWSEGVRILQQAHRIETLALRYGRGWEPRLDLVIDGSLPIEPVFRALKVMSERDIPTRVQVKTEFLGGVHLRFEQDKSDLMMVKEYTPSPTLTAQPLSPTTIVLVASRDHALSGQSHIALEQLFDHVELTIHDSSDPDKKALDSLQFGGDRVFYLSDFSSKKRALMMGLGFGWMPGFLIREELTSGDLVELDYQSRSRHTFTPQLVYPSNRPLGKAGTIMADLIKSEFSLNS
jgi:DNA-binding transcriptional LysR family regulator